MRKILGYISEFAREDVRLHYYLSIAILLVVIIAVNYSGVAEGMRIKDWMNQEFRGSERLMLMYMPFYAVPFLLSLVAFARFHNRWDIFRNADFWWRVVFVLAVLGFDSGFYYFDALGRHDLPRAEQWFLARTIGKFSSVFGIFLPLLVFRWWRDRSSESFYGLTFRGFDFKPYALMLALMIPLILTASFLDDFMRYYPRIKLHQVDALSSLTRGEAILLFEIAYAFDFIWTELLFRGFMVIGFARILGHGAVLPMATVYCMRHFAKPLGETISSVFGGILLGIIALKGRNILGGVWLHMGIAVLMEIFAFARVFGLY